MKTYLFIISIFMPFIMHSQVQQFQSFNHLKSNQGYGKILEFDLMNNSPSQSTSYRFISSQNSGSFNTSLNIENKFKGSWYPIMSFVGSKVGIHTSKPDAELTVKGKIHAEEVKVDLNIPADYVFQKYYDGYSPLKEDYVMPTLIEVENFVKKYKHLPEVPSAKEIQENGLHLKEMTNLLLQKIEELTIYTIEQEKRIKLLESKLR